MHLRERRPRSRLVTRLGAKLRAMETPQSYRLVNRSELSDRFNGMTLKRVSGNTVLVGEVFDQAHLYGLLDRIRDLGLGLLSVNPATEAPAETHTSASQAQVQSGS